MVWPVGWARSSGTTRYPHRALASTGSAGHADAANRAWAPLVLNTVPLQLPEPPLAAKTATKIAKNNRELFNLSTRTCRH
jgi:hypothetical protein